MTPPPSRRRRLLGQGLAGAPLIVTAVRHPVLAAGPQTASAYGSVMASAAADRGAWPVSSPFALSEALAEVKAALEAESRRLSSSRGLLAALTIGLLNTLLGVVGLLFGGKMTVAQLGAEHPDLHRFLVNYRSAMWPVSPAASFGSTIGSLSDFGPRSLLDVAQQGTQPLGPYCVAAFLNASAHGRIDPILLSPEKVRAIAHELQARGYFEPTAGIRWDQHKVIEWWRLSLGLRL